MEKQRPKIITTLPGPKSREIIEKDEKYLMQSNWRYLPFVPKSGHGSMVEDVDGNVFLDLVSGAAVMNVGLGNSDVIEAAIKQANEFVYSAIPGYFYHNLVSDLAEKLVRMTPGSYGKKCFFGLSGGDAADIAMKIARMSTGRQRFISFIGSNHGLGSMGGSSLQGLSSHMVKGFGPLVPGVTHVPYPYQYREGKDCETKALDYLEDYVFRTTVPPEETSGVFVEPIQGDGGVVGPSTEFFKRLREICDRYSILLVVDEVQTGFGRTGKMFAMEHHQGVEADLFLLGKPLGNGLPMSAVVGREDVMKIPRGALAITGAGHLLGCAAALAAIEYTEKEGLCANAEVVGRKFAEGLRGLMAKHELIGDVRGKGLLVGVELVKNRVSKVPAVEEITRINRIAFENGLLSAFDGLYGNVFRLMPSLTFTEEEAELAASIFDRAFSIFEEEKRI